jgi:hypothetical protein
MTEHDQYTAAALAVMRDGLRYASPPTPNPTITLHR